MADITKASPLKVTPSVLEEWKEAEYSSWEDAGYPKEGHVYNVLSKHKSIIEVRSTKEAALLIKSAYFIGDPTGLDPSLVSKRKAIGLLGDKLIAAYGIYYLYPSFRSTKTGEIIPNPLEAIDADIPTTDLWMFTVEQLRAECRKRSLPWSGNKEDLVRRLKK